MNLPKYFHFSQGNLQDFNDCRRRFYLRHVRQIAWPAVESEPFIENEIFMQQGTAFHRLAQQYFLGIPREDLAALATAPPLDEWWNNFFQYLPQLPGLNIPGARFYPELSLTATVANHRLIAKYDLIVALPEGQLIIYDWKTSRTHPRRSWLAERAQTRLYRYLLLVAGQWVVKQPVTADQISMAYWFTSFPDTPELFQYNADLAAQDEREFDQLILLINKLVEEDRPEEAGLYFPLTTKEKFCAFCQYRSLCNRGVQAGTIPSEEDSLFYDETGDHGIDLDFEQISEIEF